MGGNNFSKNFEVKISLGLKVDMKPEDVEDLFDKLIFENIGYVQSWGVHVNKEEYKQIRDLKLQIEQAESRIKMFEEIYAISDSEIRERLTKLQRENEELHHYKQAFEASKKAGSV